MTCDLPVNVQCVSGSLSGLNCISHDGFALVSFVAVLRNKSMNKAAVIAQVTDGAHVALTHSRQSSWNKWERHCAEHVRYSFVHMSHDAILVVNATVTGGKLWPITDYWNNDFYSITRFVTNTQTQMGCAHIHWLVRLRIDGLRRFIVQISSLVSISSPSSAF